MKRTLMIVDDSLFVYEEMKYMLKDSNYDIVAYSKCGEEVLEKYEGTNPDVVTMDIILPGIDGMAASASILQKYPAARIIIISSLAYDETTEQAASMGIHQLIYKPFTKEVLIDALDQAFWEE